MWAFKQYSKLNLVRFISRFCQWQQLPMSVFWLKTMTMFLLSSSLLHTQRPGETVTPFLSNPRFPRVDFLCPSSLLCSFVTSFLRRQNDGLEITGKEWYNQLLWTHNQVSGQTATLLSLNYKGFDSWILQLEIAQKVKSRLSTGFYCIGDRSRQSIKRIIIIISDICFVLFYSTFFCHLPKYL